MKVDLFVIGLGIPELHAMSVEAWSAMCRCRALFVNDPGQGVLAKACVDLRPIGNLGNAKDGEARKALIARVLSAAAQEGPVGLAIYGHPMIYEPLTTELARKSLEKGLRCRVVPGVSAFDAILASLNLSLTRGIGAQISDEEHFLAAKPNPRSLTIVYRAFYDAATVALIEAHCRGVYSTGHRAVLIECRNWGGKQKIKRVRLGALSRESGRHSMYTTIVIPPEIPLP